MANWQTWFSRGDYLPNGLDPHAHARLFTDKINGDTLNYDTYLMKELCGT